ncbi:hypothetical protein OG259_41415 (plasmid) [Streptomyces sp. NBC_00250]|uniref:hypothetical protein n=1 Tax=Streptomyces sp. NBC_00250 TaxID=2903641 RepID=UPI002E2CE122|nr:hypothetical protein [Streptomyces sp. NBC_00250]
MKIRRISLSAYAVVALLTGTVACTAGGGAADSGAASGEAASGEAASGGPAKKAQLAVDTACENGTYTWFNVDKRDVLTGVAEKQKLGKGGGKLTNRLSTLHTPRTAVTFEKGPRVDAEAALRSLGSHIGERDEIDNDDYGFADVRRPAPQPATTTSVSGAGTFVDFAFVRQVTADFRYTCGNGELATGRAISWTGDGAGVVECSTSVENVKAGEPVLEAARLSCGPNSPAARAKKA